MLPRAFLKHKKDIKVQGLVIVKKNYAFKVSEMRQTKQTFTTQILIVNISFNAHYSVGDTTTMLQN